MQVEALDLNQTSKLTFKRPIKRDVSLRADQYFLLEAKAKQMRISINKLISIAVDNFLGLETLFWYSTDNQLKYVRRCENCPSFVLAEFSDSRFYVLCKNSDCPEPDVLKRLNDFYHIPRVRIDAKI
jgi:hypothetical protein